MTNTGAAGACAAIERSQKNSCRSCWPAPPPCARARGLESKRRAARPRARQREHPPPHARASRLESAQAGRPRARQVESSPPRRAWARAESARASRRRSFWMAAPPAPCAGSSGRHAQCQKEKLTRKRRKYQTRTQMHTHAAAIGAARVASIDTPPAPTAAAAVASPRAAAPGRVIPKLVTVLCRVSTGVACEEILSDSLVSTANNRH